MNNRKISDAYVSKKIHAYAYSKEKGWFQDFHFTDIRGFDIILVS